MNAVGFKSFLRQLLPLIPNTTSISAMQKLLRSVTATIIAIPILVIIFGFLSSPAYALKETGFILMLILYLLAGIPWALFWYLSKIEPSMTKREVDTHYFTHLLFFIFVNLFAYQGSKVIIVASSHWWPSTIVTATVFSKQINKKYAGRGRPDYFIHLIRVSVPGENSMRLRVTPTFYERVKKGQHLKISLRETPLAYVYSGFYQLDSTILYE